MQRRDFLRSAGMVSAGLAMSRALPLLADASVGSWRTFEVTTHVELLKPSGESHIWLPAALIHETPFQKTHSNKFTADNGKARLTEDKQQFLGIVTGS